MAHSSLAPTQTSGSPGPSGREAPVVTSTRSPLMRALRPWMRFKSSSSIAVLALLVICAVFANWISPFDPQAQDLSRAMLAPSLSPFHPFGTDHVGRDILSRVIYGARISMVIALAVVMISGACGLLLGVISGYFGGRTDFFIQKLVEVFWAFPPLLLAIAVVAFLGQSLGILILALALQRWIPYCRVARANALTLKEREYIVAARSLGASNTRIILRHLIPNLFQSALVIGTFAMAAAIIAEASLSFLGLGVPPSVPTWGGMLADGRAYVSTAWWIAVFPGMAIFVTVLAINLLGDVLRDNLDPRLKRSGKLV
ncbi:MAG: ABC transporter permease [Beijerinckiaceae bacterium]|nr:ABC transporter permease [Beijerinckiaceae bacterium]